MVAERLKNHLDLKLGWIVRRCIKIGREAGVPDLPRGSPNIPGRMFPWSLCDRKQSSMRPLGKSVPPKERDTCFRWRRHGPRPEIVIFLRFGPSPSPWPFARKHPPRSRAIALSPPFPTADSIENGWIMAIGPGTILYLDRTPGFTLAQAVPWEGIIPVSRFCSQNVNISLCPQWVGEHPMGFPPM